MDVSRNGEAGPDGASHGAEVITYCLRDGAGSDSYYQAVIPFLDEVLAAVDERAGDLLAAFAAGRSPEVPREERVVELLLLGVLASRYGRRARATLRPARRFLRALSRRRAQVGRLKPLLDQLRGLLTGALLFPRSKGGALAPEHLESLIEWLHATGEYGHEAARLDRWLTFLASLPRDEAARHLDTALELAGWFEARSEQVLGRFTEGVEGFLRDRHPRYRWREDRVACGRARVEYHLGMVGSELLNRAFRPSFEARPRKALLLPVCMRALPDEACQAQRADSHLRCVGCTPTCRAHQLTRLGERQGYDVRLIPHASDVYAAGSAEAARGSETGIVGVACVGQLISGGWTATDRGLAAQCVPLDYCGCRAHWHEAGIPTDLNLPRLRRIMGIAPEVGPG